MKISRIVSVSVLALATALVTTVAGAATISTWNVGSGQYQDNFLYTSNASFGGGGLLELGLRTVHRQSAQRATLVGNTYTAFTGAQTAGQNGAFATHLGRSEFNFDFHTRFDDGVQTLDSLTLVITAPAGNTVTFPSYNMLIGPNDNVSNPGGDAQNPVFFIQDSQNMVFPPWFTGYNMNVTGLYTFRLTATKGADTASVVMNIDVLTIPTPGITSMLGLGGLVAMRRRR